MIGAGVETAGGQIRVAVAVRRGSRSTLVRLIHATPGTPVSLPARPQRVLAGLPLARTTHRMLDLPFTDDATLAQVVPLELRGQLPADPGPARIGFQVIERTAASARVLALLVRERDPDAAAALAVRGVSKPQESTTTTLPSFARSDRAERRASLIIFLGVRWA